MYSRARRDLVGLPDLVEQRLWHSCLDSGSGVSPAETTARKAASAVVGFSKWWGRSASKVTQSPSPELMALAVADEHDGPRSTSAVSRLPGSCIGGSPAAPVAPPGRACGARAPRAGRAGRRSSPRSDARAARCRRAGVPARTIVTAARLVQAQELGEPQLEAGGDARRDRQRRARLAALDLREHRRADAAAVGEVAQRQRDLRGHSAQRGSRAVGRGDRVHGGPLRGARGVRYHRQNRMVAWAPLADSRHRRGACLRNCTQPPTSSFLCRHMTGGVYDRRTGRSPSTWRTRRTRP